MAEPATASPVRVNDTPTLDFERPVVELERKIEELIRVSGGASELRPQIALLEARARELQQKIFAELTPWQKVQLSRHPTRPYTLDYIERLVHRLRRAARRSPLRRRSGGGRRLRDLRRRCRCWCSATRRGAARRRRCAATSASRSRRGTARRCG